MALNSLIQNPLYLRFGVQLEYGIKVIPANSSGIEPTILYATNSYIIQRSNDIAKEVVCARHDSIELKNDSIVGADYQHTSCESFPLFQLTEIMKHALQTYLWDANIVRKSLRSKIGFHNNKSLTQCIMVT
jgi:hypothetical protein